MKLRLFNTFAAVLAFTVIFFGLAPAAGGDKKADNKISTPTGSPIRTYLNINNISTVFKNTGISDIDAQEANSGLVYPKGSRKGAVYASGFLWGGIIGGEVRVGGSAYREGLQGGKILTPGVAESPDLAKNRIYRVRPDERPGSGLGLDANLSSEIADEGQSEAAIRAQYELDWNEWPVADGAPYDDVDNSGTYDPSIDVPGVPGADQSIWYVANDLDPLLTTNLYGSNPMGIEMQVTVWAYAQQGALGNMFFRKYVIINKGLSNIDSMYVSMWSDVDLGNSTDDFAGCDTTLSLGYCYNAFANDATYNPLPPPAVGFDFFQGPLVDAPGESGISNGQVVADKMNLPMTAFYYFARGDASVTDPTQGSYEGTTQFYNFFRGRIGRTGAPFEDPNTNQTTMFALAGDPQTRSGWLDGQLLPAGDRRIGLASGPFTMAVGDTQEVVVAEIVAGAIPGVDRISAIGLLKFYDLQAQLAYDNFFDLPIPPPAPEVTVAELDREIVLDWSKNIDRMNETESSSAKGFTFQGYNVYQLPSASASISEAVRVATYDVSDGVGKIFDQVFDPNTGSVVSLPVQFGNDTYLKRFISIKQDAIKQEPLINGIRYYFAVTAYNYNPDPLAVPNNLENPLRVITVTPHSNDPGVTLGAGSGGALAFEHVGTADGGPTITIVDPMATTGHDYQIFFTERAEIRDSAGNWVPSSVVKRNFRTRIPNDLTGTSIMIEGVYGTVPGQLQLHCTLDLVSPDDDWADGITMTFPAGATILSAPSFGAGGGDIFPAIVGNEIRMGLIDHEYTADGIFHGGEEWDILVSAPLPLAVDWVVFDDNYGGNPVDASGTTTVMTVGNISRLAKYWNILDVTTNTVLLENQSVINGVDLYPDRDDISTDIGLPASPIVDGFQTSMDVNYAAPIVFFSVTLNSPSGLSTLSQASSPTTTNIDISNYTIFGTATSGTTENFGVGTDDINELQQDYELRFTGVLDTSIIGGRTVISVASGGQMATIFTGVSAAELGTHPLNPNPGVNDPFLIRIPFEVWNIDRNEQVNLTFRDRAQTAASDPFYSWNAVNRMYALIVNSPYDSTQVIQVSDGPDAFNALATWILVMYGSNFHLGDVVTVTYANPVQIGSDVFNFTTTAPGYSNTLALDQIGEINVFPNPYYGVNTEELNKYQRFVTFTHLPDDATIRIFNLAGVLVKTLEKTDPGQFQKWFLVNEDGLPVASGFYIAYIDMPALGTSKILKLAVIQERQILDRF